MQSQVGIKITLVVKVSKLCNLRCTYCYETPELANRARMSIEDIGSMFRNVRDYFKQSRGVDYRKCHVQFIWHGGEPFAQPLSYWEEVIAVQKKVFGAAFQKKSIFNTVQTNLTLVSEKHLPLLQEHFSVGFSYDVANDLRVDAAGKPTDAKVTRKVDWAREVGLELGGIAVISRVNAARPEQVADYFLSRNIGFRALNIYQSLDLLPQIRDAAIPFADYVAYCRRLYAMPEVRRNVFEGLLDIEPLTTAHERLGFNRDLKKPNISVRDCVAREWALGVNTNGDTYAIGDVYYADFRYGNIFTQPMQELLDSEGRARRMARSRERMARVCKSCFLFRKGCPGTYVSHATPESYRDYEQAGGCEIAFLAKDMKDATSGRHRAGAQGGGREVADAVN